MPPDRPPKRRSSLPDHAHATPDRAVGAPAPLIDDHVFVAGWYTPPPAAPGARAGNWPGTAIDTRLGEHAPFEHDRPARQLLPHAAHVRLEVRFASQPFAPRWSQSSKPALHGSEQAPATHAALPLMP